MQPRAFRSFYVPVEIFQPQFSTRAGNAAREIDDDVTLNVTRTARF
jgi:hypothetical protein